MNERTRFWDRNYNLVYDSHTDAQEPEEFLREYDWLNATVDTPDGRWAGRWINSNGIIEKHRADEHLSQIRAWANPFIAPERQFPRHEGPTWVDLLNMQIAIEWRRAGMDVPLGYDPLRDDPLNGWEILRRDLSGDCPIVPDLPRADGKPHPPRPSRTPPMWANNPTKQRRRR